MNARDTRPDQLQDTRNIFAFAALLAVAFAGIGVVGDTLAVVAYSFLPATVCGLVGVLLALAGFFLAPRIHNLPALSAMILVALVIDATLAIHFAGGPQSFLTALYIGITVGAAFLIGRGGALGIALFSAACFSLLTLLHFTGVLPVYPIWSATLDMTDRSVVLGGLIFSMIVPTFVVAYVSGTLAERLARRTAEQATLAQIERDIASSLDPDQVIQTVLRRAIDNTTSDRGAIYLYDAQERRVIDAASIGLPKFIDELNSDRAGPRGIVGRVLRAGHSARVGDVTRDRDYIEGSSDTRSELCVPIVRDDRVEGVINLESTRPNAYTGAHQAFVEQLAQHAAIALSNARLYAQTERNLYEVARANLEIHALQESMAAIQSALELDDVLPRICDAVVTLGYELALVATAERDGQQLAVRAIATADAHIVTGIEATLGFRLIDIRTKLNRPRNIGVRALSERRVLVSGNTADFLYPFGAHSPRSQALSNVGMNIGAAIPLIVRDRPLGVLYAFSRKADLTEAELSSLRTFGAQAALAVDKANLFEEARTVRDRLQAVLDATHDGLIVYDVHTRMVLTNRAAEHLLDVSLSPHLGKPMAMVLDRSGLIDRLYPGIDASERRAAIDTEANVMSTGLRDGSSEVARRLITLPGAEPRYVEEFNMRVDDEHGLLIGRLVVLHNVTDQRRLEADRDAFTQMLVHDLRSPLSSIISGMQLLELGIQEGDSGDLLLRSVRIALASANKLLGLISSLLDMQKLETGQLELKLQPLAPASLIRDGLETLRPLAEMSGITLDIDSDYDMPAAQGDAEHIRRVLINLVDNALKFAGVGGSVRVSAAPDGDFVRFSVVDNGPGIPAEYRERIFARYVQVPGSSGRRRGTGLGLTYCKMIIEMHGGRIWVEDAPVRGSKFLFTLPVVHGG
ncbi:MAG TPA: GAF domain-containing protein [Anaerolineae bacterium]